MIALQCSVQSWRRLLQSARALRRLEVDLAGVPEGAFEVLFEDQDEGGVGVGKEGVDGHGVAGHAANGVSGANGVNGVNGTNGTNGTNGVSGTHGVNGKGKARATSSPSSSEDEDDNEETSPKRVTSPSSRRAKHHLHPHPRKHTRSPRPILPALTTLRLSNIASGAELARLAVHRRAWRRPVRRWEVEEGGRDEDAVRLEREMEEVSARSRAEVESGAGAEPWRMDEPAEKLVWYREEVPFDEEEEEDGEGEDDGEGAEE